MKKKFVPRKPVSEASALQSMRPTEIIVRNDYMLSVLEGEKFWRVGGTGEIETMVSFSRFDKKGKGNNAEWREHVISIGSDGRRIETASTHDRVKQRVCIIMKPQLIVKLKGTEQPLSAVCWCGYNRAKGDDFNTLLAVADIHGVTKLINMDEGILEIVEVL